MIHLNKFLSRIKENSTIYIQWVEYFDLYICKSCDYVMTHENTYEILFSGKPTCKSGEPKTDIYILAESYEDDVEIKISYKKELIIMLLSKKIQELESCLYLLKIIH